MTPKQIYEDMVQVLAVDSFSYATVKKGAAEFERGRDSIEDDPLSGRSKTSITVE